MRSPRFFYTQTKEGAAPALNEETDRIMEENVNEKISVIHYTKGEKKFIIGVKSSRKRWKVGGHAVLIGEFDHNIDKKGRMILPAKLREELGDSVIVNRGLDGCLYVYTKEQWEKVYQRLSTLPSTRKDARMYARMMLSKAAECEFDAQGRILIPAGLVKLAHLQKECKIIGVGTHVEIWDKDTWLALEEEQNDCFEDVAESLTEFEL